MTVPAILENLAAYSLQAAILIAAAGALAALSRLRSPRILLVYWQAVLLAALLLPAVQPWHRAVIVPLDTMPAIELGSAPVVKIDPAAAPFPVYQAILAVLAFGVAARLLWLAAGALRLWLFRRRSAPLSPLSEDLARLRFWMGTAADLRISGEVGGPVTFGILRPVVLMPESFTRMATEIQYAVLCHELVHVRRRDWLITLAEEIVRAWLWFHPAVWFALARIRLAREQAVDRETIEWTGDRRKYLEALLESAGLPGHQRRLLAPAPLFLSEQHFTQRVRLIVKEVSMSTTRLVLTLAAIMFLLVPAATLAVRTFPLQGSPVLLQAAPQEQPPLPPPEVGVQRIKVGGNVQQANLVEKTAPVYPALARQARIQGTVRFTAIIGADGSVKNLMLTSGHPLLVPAAQDAVRNWRYRPTFLNGSPVEVITNIDVSFTLAESGEPRVMLGAPPLKPFPSAEPDPGVKRIQVTEKAQREKLSYSPPATYPPLAEQARIRGIVRLRVLVSVDGGVKEMQPVSGHPLLMQAAQEAVKQYRFQPTTVDGQPAEVVTEITVPFPHDLKASEMERGAMYLRGVPGGVPGGVIGGIVGGVPGGAYRVGDGVSAPRLVRKLEPEYSPEAKQAQIEGTVILSVVVEPDGHANNPQVMQGIGYGLDEKALDALKEWRFAPGLKDGQPVPVQATIEINFRLK